MVKSLTCSYQGVVNVITTPVEVKNPVTKDSMSTHAIWDTGATNSVVTHAVAQKLGLAAMGKSTVLGVHGPKDVNVYFVNLTLNNKDISLDIPVTECDELSADNSIGMLVGMDIISQGDFTITNLNRKTTMSFRIPSMESVDYVAQSNMHTPVKAVVKPGRNEPCPCGSGKKFKYCCGRK